jgi:hypothetical protein
VTAGIRVAQKLRRNTKITITTSATMSINVNCTSATEARMVWVRSEMTLTLTAAGIEASSTGSIALTRPTVSMTLAPGWRWIARMIARCWLNQAAISSFSPALMAWPISRMRTGDPLR